MPEKALRKCPRLGCRKLTRGGRCPEHEVERQQQRDDSKDDVSVALYHTRRWQRLRLQVLADEPLCRLCAAEGKVEAATVVDHVEPHRGDPRLFFRRSNLQGLCKPHHDRKTGGEVQLRRAAFGAGPLVQGPSRTPRGGGGGSECTPPSLGDRRAGGSRARPGFRPESASSGPRRGP